MLDFLIILGWVILYLAIGVFLDTLLGNGEPTYIMWVLWPVALLLVLVFIIGLYIPDKLAKWVKNKLDM